MDGRESARYEALAKILKAMSHPARLLIIEKLSIQEHCVCELTEMIGTDTSTVSKHLSVLKNAGVVTDKKQSQMVYYSLAMPCTVNFLSCLDKVIKETAEARLALVN